MSDIDLNMPDKLWVFGYGSLLWKPDFEYSRRQVGRIVGFKRRFWQGSKSHRGTDRHIGRVATIVNEEESVAWGEAFEIQGKDAIRRALGGLTKREQIFGGYDVIQTRFYPRDAAEMDEVNVYVYMATPENTLYLGGKDIETMATEIVKARGFAGTNVEYIKRLAEYVRKHIPEDDDPHLFDLYKAVLRQQAARTFGRARTHSDYLDSEGETDSDSDTASVISEEVRFEHLHDVDFDFLTDDSDL